MADMDTLDLLVLVTLLLGTLAYLTKGSLWAKEKGLAASAYNSGAGGGKGGAGGDDERNVAAVMAKTGKNCVIFYGSQTGTAEDYASRLAKEGKSRFGLETMTADLEEYDFDSLDTIPSDKVVMFVLATYGEGEPTDNAVDFYEFIMADDVSFSQDNSPPLASLNYVIFGLGNNTYEYYNVMVRRVNGALEKLGANRIGAAGEGDDGSGTMEEDFLAWKDPMWRDLAAKLGLEEREAVYEPMFAIQSRADLTPDAPNVYLGEPNKRHLEGTSSGPYNAHNPWIAPIVESRELFSAKDRNCLHVEVDLAGSNITYTTGDHIAVWPTNPGQEVDRFLRALGLIDKRSNVIGVKPLEPMARVPFPTPTTYDAIVRYHMEICAPVSRQFLATLAAFAPDDEARAEMARLGDDKDYFQDKVSRPQLSIAGVLSLVGRGKQWPNIPFSAMIESLHKLQPRYYSISSSSLVQPTRIAITAVVDAQMIDGRQDMFCGVATNYLLALKQKQNGDPDPTPFGMSYEIAGPRNKYDGIHVPIHVRHSSFRFPSDPSRPIIMVGPGTGVAPFRASVQERARLVRDGNESVGKTMLFFGCRRRKEDFLYESEWEEYKNIMGDKFDLHLAFSREGPEKVYVQHRLKEAGEEVNRLLQHEKANFYVCGDAAHMAREVNALLIQIIAQHRDIPETKAEQIVKTMRSSNQYQEDVWS